MRSECGKGHALEALTIVGLGILLGPGVPEPGVPNFPRPNPTNSLEQVEYVEAQAAAAAKAARDLKKAAEQKWQPQLQQQQCQKSGPVEGRFTSKDPLVSDLANEIESAYPGHVKGVNVPVKDPVTGKLLTDIDIELQNANIQVKTGNGNGMGPQVTKSIQANGKPTIGYGPDLGRGVQNDVANRSGLVTTNKDVLIKVVKPNPPK